MITAPLRRYSFEKVLAYTTLASVCLIVYIYVYRIAIGAAFNWTAYWEYLPNQCLGTLATAAYYYFSVNHFHQLFVNRRPASAFLVPVILTIFAVEAYNLVVDRLLPLSSNIKDPIPVEQQLLGHFLVSLAYLGTAILIAYINFLRQLKKRHRELEAQALRLEVEKAQTELKFLKSQINPHFLYNTLNSLYARSLPFSSELSEAILTLSDTMRYALEDAQTAEGKVYLKDEINQVRNLIKLNQLRFRKSLQVDLEVNGVVNGYMIIPFILLTMVENIFKHGDLTDNNYPVKMVLNINNGGLHYSSQNKKKTGPKELTTGIGLDNLKRRLDIAYENEYELNIKDESEFYSIHLMIDKL
jgi:two-component system, LytTR family, sensor kinase